jgi:hypothetical protein
MSTLTSFSSWRTSLASFFRRTYIRIEAAGISDVEALALCMIMTFVLYCHLFIRGKYFSGGDFPPAVSIAMNFKLALADGQWLPRWIIVSREFTFGGGGLDATTPTADSPFFIYYGFLLGVLAQPFMLLRIHPVMAVHLVAFVTLGMGAFALYLAGRTLGAGRMAALVGAFSYLASPWLLSNFYHRGGMAELLSQAGLPFIVLGLTWLNVGRMRAATLMIAFAMAWFALAHNVFLMIAAWMLVLLGAAYFVFGKPRFSGSLYARTHSLLIIGVGAAIGLLATAWQWLPIWMTFNQFPLGASIAQGGSFEAFADFSGALGFPKPFYVKGAGPTNFFFTIGWWTIPAALSLLVQKTDRRLGVILFVCFTVFFVLTYFTGFVASVLPKYSLALQWSFRLLAILSVVSAIAIPMVLPRMSWRLGVALIALMGVSQLPLLLHPVGKQQMAENAFLGGYEYNAFYANSPNDRVLNNALRIHNTGWLDPKNIILFGQQDNQPAFLRLRGMVNPQLKGAVRLQLRQINPAAIDAHTMPSTTAAQSDSAEVTGSFDITLSVHRKGLFRLIAEPANESETIRTVEIIKPGMVSLIQGPLSSYVFADDVQKIDGHGYWRTFRVAPAVAAQKTTGSDHQYAVELPMIYNQFSVARQRGSVVPYESDFNHRILVRVSDLTEPITVRFELPWLAYVLTCIGGIALLALIWAHKMPAPLRSIFVDRIDSRDTAVR